MSYSILRTSLFAVCCAALLLPAADFSIIDATGGGVLALRGASFALSKAADCTVSVDRRDAAWGLDKLQAGDAAVLVLDAPDLPADFKAAASLELASEALVLYANTQNSLQKITQKDAVALLVGAAPTWEKLTGDPAGVHRYRVKAGGQGRGTAERLLKQALPKGYYELGSLTELLLLASTDPKSLVIGRYQDLYPEEMYPLAVDGVMPGLQSIRAGKYPFSRRIVLVSRLPEKDPRLAKFLSILRGRSFYDDLLDEGLLPSAALAK